MTVVYAALCGFVIDLLLGDPAWMPHPVVFMGRCISALEKLLRRIFPKTPKGELAGGVILAAVLPLGTLALTGLCVWGLGLIHPALSFALQVLWCWQALAAKGLRQESDNVRRALVTGTLDDARKAVSRIVGRDTAALSREGVIRAAVETVAENFSDGVVAPLFWMLLGGAPLALAYKAVNTMDSMVGYKNDRYLYFGRAAAKLDDAANWLPSRLAALLLVAAAPLIGQNAGRAFAIWRRDRRKHASPNSAQTESAMAGALGVRLAGPASYFGKIHQKPWIGDDTRPIEPEDITRAGRMLYAGSVLALLLLCGARLGILALIL
ncbi:cobalamin biosynthesis protein CobD [Subdoligranulum sp. DSM 109015]|uniref:Cobalamin biosynthesis protein CobD n=1 Tax=Gemmiger gallinarum TaxID=2779354 RepID=A0ABR9R314_9FIRM|nr:adenosylcobinamide-phosphate synthase CbiB [Gemmiger gallinarum]MBE5037506.1 cobalamin biosynthesis protein CobD [Gemmiger gallinarum]